MRIYIVRHGDAGLTTIGMADAERQLTAKGERQAERVGAALRVIGDLPDVIFTSPLPRARQTAEHAVHTMAEKRHRPPVHLMDRLAPGAYAGDVLSAIPVEIPSVMLVGHQPTLGALVGVLIDGLHAAPIDLSKASLVCLETVGAPHPGAAELGYLLGRRIISALAKNA